MAIQHSYRQQVIVFLVLFLALFSISSLYYLKTTQNNFIAANLETEAQVISNLLAEDFSKLIFLNDPDVLATIALKMQSIKEIRTVNLYDLNHQLILHLGDKNTEFKSVNKITTHIEYDGLKLGTAELTLYNRELVQEQQKANITYILFMVVLLLGSILLIVILDKRFIARLSHLSSALKQAARHKDYSLRLTVNSEDDIGQAQKHFNELVSIVEHQFKELNFQAHHDALTGLYNRHQLTEKLENILLTRPEKNFHAVVYIDLDNFKVVNDTCGHAAGDELLKQLSSCFIDTLSDFNQVTLGRIGGDEFIVLVEDLSKGEIHSIAHKLQKQAEGFKFLFLEREFQIGLSLGCVMFQHEKVSASELLSAADSLCYQVKNTNRGESLIRYIEDEDLMAEHDLMDWVSHIYHAISLDDFKVYLQPIVDMQNSSEKWNHFESLIRLHKENEVIAPYQFIPVAEKFGLTKKLDAWMVDAVFYHLTENPQFLKNLKVMSINLSILSIVDEKFLRTIQQLFDIYDIPKQKICFEVTETAVVSKLDKAFNFIDHFRKLGVKFSLDDFGSGMSSFGYLSKMTVDYLKIDGQFIQGICGDVVKQEMVVAMIKIAHATNKLVVAEHVEDAETVTRLTAIQADYIQGYYFSKPKPISAFY